MCTLGLISIPHQRDTFVTAEEPTGTHRHHPKPIFYVSVLSRSCAFCGFEQMSNGLYPPCRVVSLPKSPLCAARSSLLPGQRLYFPLHPFFIESVLAFVLNFLLT